MSRAAACQIQVYFTTVVLLDGTGNPKTIISMCTFAWLIKLSRRISPNNGVVSVHSTRIVQRPLAASPKQSLAPLFRDNLARAAKLRREVFRFHGRPSRIRQNRLRVINMDAGGERQGGDRGREDVHQA